MKTIFLIGLMLLGCTKPAKDESNNIPKDLIGKWKIVEIYETDGGSDPEWRDEDTGAIYDYWFKPNGTFLQSDGIYNGTYTIDTSMRLTFTINSSDTVLIEQLTSSQLIIDFLNFEPYKHKYIKVSSESE